MNCNFVLRRQILQLINDRAVFFLFLWFMNRSDQADFIKSKHSSQNNHYTEAFSYLSVNDSNVYSVGKGTWEISLELRSWSFLSWIGSISFYLPLLINSISRPIRGPSRFGLLQLASGKNSRSRCGISSNSLPCNHFSFSFGYGSRGRSLWNI